MSAIDKCGCPFPSFTIGEAPIAGMPCRSCGGALVGPQFWRAKVHAQRRREAKEDWRFAFTVAFVNVTGFLGIGFALAWVIWSCIERVTR